MIAGSPGGSFIISNGGSWYAQLSGRHECRRHREVSALPHQYLPDEVDYESGALSDAENQGS